MEEWRPLVEKYFGEETDNALRIMECESQGSENAIGDGHLKFKQGTIEYGASYGLFQIRHLKGRPSPSFLLDPENNVKYAYQIYQAQSWKPWTCRRVLTNI